MTYNIVYHGTSKKRAQEIFEKGYDFSKLGEKTGYPLPGLSTTISESEAKEHADWAAKKFNDEPAIVEYNITGMKIMPGSDWSKLFNQLKNIDKVISKAKRLGFDGIQLFDLDEEEGLEEYEILLFKEPKMKRFASKVNKIIESILKESMIEQIDKELQPVMKKFWDTFGTGNISTESCIGHNESPDTFQHFYIKLNNKEIEEKPLLQFFLASVFKKPNIKEQEEDGHVVISTKYFREDGKLPEGVKIEDVKKANKLAFEDFKNALDEYAKTNILKEQK